MSDKGWHSNRKKVASQGVRGFSFMDELALRSGTDWAGMLAIGCFPAERFRVWQL